MNDHEFVAGLRRQDLTAIKHLSECLLPSIWRYVYFRVHGDQHLAEDVVSETALALVKAVSASETELVCPTAWMRTVATRKIQDHFRAVARVQHLVDQAESMVGHRVEASPSEKQEAAEQQDAVRKVMDDLPEQYRLVLEWKYVDQLSVREIAGRIETTEKAVESILFRARREFRDGMGDRFPQDVPLVPKGTSVRASANASSISGRNQCDFHQGDETRLPVGFKDLKQSPS